MSGIPYKATGWRIVNEAKPSLNRHFLPPTGGHQLSASCWCKPELQGEPQLEPPYTMVMHQDVSA